MSELDTETKHIDDAELLLPWYVAGTLSEAETAKVDAWLAEAPEAQAHLQRAIEEHETTLSAADDIPMPRASAVNDLMAAIGADTAQQAGPSLMERIWDMLSPRYAMAGAAALALVVVGQGITIGTMMNTAPATFETASGESAVVDETTALIAFQPSVSVEQISAYLAENKLRIADGPKPGGIYIIAAEQSDAGKAALDALGSNQTLVRFYSAGK